jgi:hypothetical protein
MSITPIRTWRQSVMSGLPAIVSVALACLFFGGLIFYFAAKASTASRAAEAQSRSVLREREQRLAAEKEAKVYSEAAATERRARLAAEKQAQAQAEVAERERQARLAAEKIAEQESIKRKLAEAATQKMQKDLEQEQALRLAAEQDAEETKQSATEVWQIARVVNRTQFKMKFQIRGTDGTWNSSELAAGAGRTYWQTGKTLDVQIDSSTRPGNQMRTYTLDTKTVTDGPPTDEDKVRAPETDIVMGSDANGYEWIEMRYVH